MTGARGRQGAMRLACIDIGTNTTRLLVAEPDGHGLSEVGSGRVFADLGHVRSCGEMGTACISEVVRATVAHAEAARAAGAEAIDVVATAGVRAAQDRQTLCDAIAEASGLQVRLLSGEEEARLAFAGATHAATDHVQATLGVIDVGGGSTELVVGTRAGGVTWSVSLPIGSAVLTEQCLDCDPPDAAELATAVRRVQEEFLGVTAPEVSAVYAVGGSATTLARLIGTVLDAENLLLIGLRLSRLPSAEITRTLGLDPRRARLLPGGIVLLEQAVRTMGGRARIAAGGLREGVILERLATSAHPS